MDRAINKSTNKLVNALEVFKNGSYQNLNKGEWISPRDSISNWDDISEEDTYVHYVAEKAYENYKGTKIFTSPYFAVYPGSKANTVPESPIHKMLKDWLFNRLKLDDLDILFAKGVKPHKYENKYKFSELDINWNDYSIEVTTKGTRNLRADILLPFNSKHQLLGSGIIFEIQLSEQTNKETYERTIGRALHGYSVCWLFEDNFIIKDNTIQLKSNSLRVNSFNEQMHFAKKKFVGKLKQVVQKQCRYLDEKIDECNFKISELELKEQNILENIESKNKSCFDDFVKSLKERELILINKIERMENNPYKELVETYKNDLQKTKDILVDNIFSNNDALKSNFEFWNKKLNYPITFGICPKCNNGYMTKKKGKFGIFYSCSNWSKYGEKCGHIINIKEIDNEKD